MSKLTCMEAVFDVLAGASTAGLDHECLDDLVMGCYAMASGESSEPDVAAWIAARDKERRNMIVTDDVIESRGAAKPSAVIAKAIAAGKEAL